MKILNLIAPSDSIRYRWMVFSRTLLAVVGGFIIANLSVPLIALSSGGNLALATYSAVLFSFTVWLLVVLWVFNADSAKKAWGWTVGIAVVMQILVIILKWWRLS